MTARLARLRGEEGIALVVAVALMALVVVVAGTLLTLVAAESTSSRHAVTRDGAYQAAEAGFNAYMADLTEDPSFYVDALAKGEATRTVAGTTYVSSPDANVKWNLPADTSWTYETPLTAPDAQQAWRPLGNGYEYLIEVYPVSSQEVRLVTFGRPAGSTDTTTYRAIETYARSLSVSDFQMLAASDIAYGSGASTTGMIYAGIDNSNRAHSISHNGSTASGDLLAEGSITGNVTMVAPASKYTPSTSPSIRSKIRNPILFSDLIASPLLAAFPAKAQASGIYLNPASNAPDAWWFTFNTNGTVDIQSCVKASTTTKYGTTTYPVEYKQPTCTPYQTGVALSSDGEDIYTGQDAIVSGHVNARVTVFSNQDVIVGGNIDYVSPGSVVLGLIAKSNVIVPCWEPENNLSWRAATIALTGVWASDWDGSLFSPSCSSGYHSSMTFTGSTAAYGTGTKAGSMGGFYTRTYNYDSTLRYLIPPDYPRISSQFTIVAQREIPVG